MTDKEIRQYIDEGADHYVRLFGEAAHMEKVDKPFYSYVKPKTGKQGISFIYHVRIHDLPTAQQEAVLREMRSLRMPIWFGSAQPADGIPVSSGQRPTRERERSTEDGETYLAILPGQEKACPKTKFSIIQVHTAEEFAVWANMANELLANGRMDVHPVHHFVWCKKFDVTCYILYQGNVPVSIAAIMDDKGICSLEFVATIPEMRKKGFARAVCQKAVSDAFAAGASIVTVRASNTTAAKLYQSIGFVVYG